MRVFCTGVIPGKVFVLFETGVFVVCFWKDCGKYRVCFHPKFNGFLFSRVKETSGIESAGGECHVIWDFPDSFLGRSPGGTKVFVMSVSGSVIVPTCGALLGCAC